MILVLDKFNERDDYHYFQTDRSVTVQIGRSTNAGRYVWCIFHPDFRGAIWGDESESFGAAKTAAEAWITHNVVPVKT